MARILDQVIFVSYISYIALLQMVDLIAQDRLQKERDSFIETIDESSIRRLASSYHNGDECDFFQPPKCGRFIMSYYVRFLNGDSWVVRVPISPCLAFDAQQLVEREVVTMQLSSHPIDAPPLFTRPWFNGWVLWQLGVADHHTDPEGDSTEPR